MDELRGDQAEWRFDGESIAITYETKGWFKSPLLKLLGGLDVPVAAVEGVDFRPGAARKGGWVMNLRLRERMDPYAAVGAMLDDRAQPFRLTGPASTELVASDQWGLDNQSWDHEALGYHRPAGHRLTAAARIPMAELAPEARIESFAEIVAGYDHEAARQEADRCISCGLCIATCPTHMAIPDYIAAVRDGDYERGVRLLYETNPFSAVCGRVCTHKCETSCAARHDGDPIAIRWLKRHLLDQVTPDRVRAIVGGPGQATGHRIAIVGAGPAGLTAAFDLARQGHGVTVFEAQDQPGGMTRWGIPEYRLPYAAIDRDIDIIRSVGVEIRCNCPIGGLKIGFGIYGGEK